MSCSFRGTCGCGYQFVSSNINVVWKRLVHDGDDDVEVTAEAGVNHTDASTRGTVHHLTHILRYDTIRYDTRCCLNVRSKADTSRLNLPHGNDN